jgi:hypothetical protein
MLDAKKYIYLINQSKIKIYLFFILKLYKLIILK